MTAELPAEINNGNQGWHDKQDIDNELAGSKVLSASRQMRRPSQ
jgi:hypothetical protein